MTSLPSLPSFPQHLFAPLARGITVTLICMHGDADAFTTHSSKFPLTDDGRARAAFLLSALELLPDEVARDREASLETLCDALASRLQCDAAPLVPLLNPLVRTDCRFDDYTAMPVGYVVEQCDEHSRVTRAVFAGRGVRQLWPIAACYLDPWA
jgi:hypothetical protein